MWNGYSTTSVPQWEEGKSSISKKSGWDRGVWDSSKEGIVCQLFFR